jgi:hypothetical protein
MLCITRLAPNTIKTKKVMHIEICTQIKKTHLQTTKIQVQNTQNNHMFVLCVLEFQSMKDETFGSHTMGIHTPPPLPPKTLFTLN